MKSSSHNGHSSRHSELEHEWLELFLSARTISITSKDGDLYFYLESDFLTLQELGRLLLLNGKRRAEGIQLILECPAPLARQLIGLGLHRILWIEEA